MSHIADEAWDRLLRGELDPRDEVALFRHIGACSDCAGRAPVSAERTKALVHTWLAADDAEGQPDVDTRRRVWLRNALAVAAVVVIAIGIGTTIGRDTPSPQAPPKIVTATPLPRPAGPPPPAPSRYDDAEWQTLVDDATETGTLRFPSSLATLRPREDSLRGAPEAEGDALAPAGVVVDEDRPRFTWRSVEGATYIVSVFEDELPVARSEPLGTNEWRPRQRLPRGRTYTWQVEVVRDGVKDVFPAPPAPPAMFRITTQADHDDLARARESHPGDHLLHAVLAARAGLRDEALAAWRRAGQGAPIVTNDAQ